VSLLFEILEGKEPTIAGETLTHFGQAAVVLKEHGLLRPDGHLPVAADEDDRPVTLTWSESGFGYFSETDGWVSVPDADIQRFRVDVERVIGLMTSKLALAGRRTPLALVPDHLWELGTARFGRRQKRNPVLFGRRIRDPGIAALVSAAVRKRPSAETCVLLTGTPSDAFGQSISACLAVSVRDLLTGDADLSIDADRVAIRLGEIPRIADQELVVLADGAEVWLYGRVFKFKKGVKQRAVIRYLHGKYREGVLSVPSTEVAEACDLAFHSRIRDLFKKSEAWDQLLTEEGGMCRFMLRDY
ncbi:MAG: hypothetical protein AB7V46_20115, partial [Thermomicrobiales bacterium]